ncbi:dipeptide ABC transporter ATP-binding protein [Candidatus Epulonipiscium fishelsonii]|uniref:Dipeptide ABC transporter ATP-binding protein n=1 Tax=Candidatus Epulonipiscium fishelsonii TaxID=77094 RepID=A0ACC8X7R8_9FIRM|nr:dipeptide ABC transporter ATP-binding protein [Epulopiscium sp. SCG-B11WGA-EpuloA1]
MDTVLEIKNLHVHYVTDDMTAKAVNGISFSVNQGESMGLVGETGAGKTTTALSILQLLPEHSGVIVDGEIFFEGKNLIYNTDKENQSLRGSGISMIFQDPMTALNPIMTVGNQLSEILITHNKISRAKAKQQVIDILEIVGVKADRYDDYPHQFSGGQKQRVVIAMSLLCKPKFLIADEPTTALDVTIQAQVLEIINGLRAKFNMAMMLITHDLGVVAETCDKVAIMYVGQIVESGSVKDVYLHPKHPYTKGLFDSIPKLDDNATELIPIEGQISNSADLPSGCYFHPRCRYCKDICKSEQPPIKGDEHKFMCHFDIFTDEIDVVPQANNKENNLVHFNKEETDILIETKRLKKYFPVPVGFLHAVDDVNLTIKKGETLGIVGESGCGKSTLGRVILRLHEATSGEVIYDGMDINNFTDNEMRFMRQDMQIIFQDPYASLNPRMTIGKIIGEPLKLHKVYKTEKDVRKKVEELMNLVGLPHRSYNQYPHEFDGGRRQRVVIARALAINPKFIVCDEPVSALDVSIQAQILNLLMELQQKMGLTYMFISHDLSVVKHISTNIGVMYLGQMIERAPKNTIFTSPLHPYTIALLSAIPSTNVMEKSKKIVLKGEISSPINPKSVCRFASRCPFSKDICTTQTPKLLEIEPEHFVACHRSAEIKNKTISYDL